MSLASLQKIVAFLRRSNRIRAEITEPQRSKYRENQDRIFQCYIKTPFPKRIPGHKHFMLGSNGSQHIIQVNGNIKSKCNQVVAKPSIHVAHNSYLHTIFPVHVQMLHCGHPFTNKIAQIHTIFSCKPNIKPSKNLQNMDERRS